MESVKLKDGRYIDTEGVYDFEQKKTQKEINKGLNEVVDVPISFSSKYTPEGQKNWCVKCNKILIINLYGHTNSQMQADEILLTVPYKTNKQTQIKLGNVEINVTFTNDNTTNIALVTTTPTESWLLGQIILPI